MSKIKESKEIRYDITMSIAADMLKKGIITEDDYCAFETKMREKYKPVFGVLFFEKPSK